jgi:hypothetical protein
MVDRDALFAAISTLVAASKTHGSGGYLVADSPEPPPFTLKEVDDVVVWLVSLAATYNRLAKEGKWPGITPIYSDDDDNDDDDDDEDGDDNNDDDGA